MVPDEVLESHDDGETEEGLFPGEVPGGDGAGDGDVLAGDDELGDPEPAKDVIESHPGEELVCDHGQFCVKGLHLRLGLDSRLINCTIYN